MMQHIFSTPLFTYNSGIVPHLLEEIAALHDLDSEWRSSHDFLQRRDGACGELNRRLADIARMMTGELVWRWRAPRQADGWINITPPGAFIAPHRHQGADLCGTYYVQAAPDCGELELQAGAGTTPFHAVHRIEPKAGMFVMFPGYLYHWVRPNRSEQTRISISWNMTW